MPEILLYIETDRNKVPDYVFDLITGVNEISENTTVSGVVVLNNEFNLNEEIKVELKKYGLDKLYVIKGEKPFFDKREEPSLIVELIKKVNPEIFLLTSTSAGRELAPSIASFLDTGLTADCTALEILNTGEKIKLLSTRPTFGGKLMATILCKRSPQMATVRRGTFQKKEIFKENPLNVIYFDFETSLNFKADILEFVENKTRNSAELQNARVILAGGVGLKNKENFDKLKLLASKIGAAAGGTRKAIDKGFIEKEFQIGQTGLTVTPEIYVAFGISGAIHHITGMENSKKIIAVNIDKNAPVFNYADVGYINDAVFVIDELLKKLN